MERRSQNVKDLYAAGDLAGGKEAQAGLEQMEMKYNRNRKEAESKGWGGSGLGMSDEDYDLMSPKQSPEEVAAEVAARNAGTYGTDTKVVDPSAFVQKEGRGGSGSLIPAKPDAPSVSYDALPAQVGRDRAGPERKPISAAETHTAPSSQYQLQGKEREREQSDLIDRITGKGSESHQTSLPLPGSVAGGSPTSDPVYKTEQSRLDMRNDLLTPEQRQKLRLQGIRA
jgi:hypothetical protein